MSIGPKELHRINDFATPKEVWLKLACVTAPQGFLKKLLKSSLLTQIQEGVDIRDLARRFLLYWVS